MNAKLPAPIKRKIRVSKGGPLTLDASKHPCALHLTHRPRLLIVQKHHLVPKYLQAKALGAPDADSVSRYPGFDARTINLDGTSHDTVHAIIDSLVRLEDVSVNARHMNEYALAAMGYEGFQAMVAKYGGTTPVAPEHPAE